MTQRTVLNLGDIVAVPRHSPPRARKHTPWHPQPDGQVTTVRPGQREWFSDRVFVEPQDGHERSGYSASLVMHVCASVAVLAFLISRPAQPIVVRTQALEMPAFVTQLPTPPVAQTPMSPTVDRRPSSAPPIQPADAAPPPPADLDRTSAPVEAPSGITAEFGAEHRVGGVEGGTADGIAGGVVGGTGTEPSASAPSGPTVMRAGIGMKPPRKIKDVKPVYPPGALPMHAQGAVLIDAIIGTDGRVQDVRLLHSVVALLDEAALDAVRRWEYEPTFLNGVPVAVVMTVVVNFALQ
jgi:protein TonB